MKTSIVITFMTLFFFSTGASAQTLSNKISPQEKSDLLLRAVKEKLDWLANPENHMAAVSENNKALHRIDVAEKYLLKPADQGSFRLMERIAYNPDKGLRSFVYVQSEEMKNETSSDKAFSRPAPVNSWTGYMLFNNGCFYHGTLEINEEEGLELFYLDSGNNGYLSVGFEDFCLDDEVFAGLC